VISKTMHAKVPIGRISPRTRPNARLGSRTAQTTRTPPHSRRRASPGCPPRRGRRHRRREANRIKRKRKPMQVAVTATAHAHPKHNSVSFLRPSQPFRVRFRPSHRPSLRATAMAAQLTITRPDDWHLHLRDGGVLEAVLPHRFARLWLLLARF
jgi:hypothetical protein